VAFVLHSEAQLSRLVEGALRKQGVDYERHEWKDFTLLLVESPPHEAFLDIPPNLGSRDWIPAPAVADGFN
jgi:hypothetical protein